MNPSKWIRIERQFPLPSYVRDALNRLDQAGHVAYVVGGSVRDFLLGRESKDHDIATSADPDEICALFPGSITVGKAFGVIKVPIDSGVILEIATFREDLEYEDSRHPKGVVFAGPGEDAQRRDFTINGLFYDAKTHRILDSVEGMVDLKAHLIRAIGDPSERFREDALRLLRAVRFSSTLGFAIEEKTALAIRERARLVSKVSGERVREELDRMFGGPRPAHALKQLSDLGLLGWVLPEVEAIRTFSKELWEHTLRVLDHLSRQTPQRLSSLSWAAVLHDIGKPVVARKSATAGSGGNGAALKETSGHEKEGIRLVQSLSGRLKLPHKDIAQILALIENHVRFNDVYRMRESTLQRFIRQPHFDELLRLHKADAMASGGNLAYYEFCNSLYVQHLKAGGGGAPKLLSGEDLIQLGFKPGPTFTEILETVEDLALERKLATKEEALEYVVKHFVG